jgi:hypothetical protein
VCLCVLRSPLGVRQTQRKHNYEASWDSLGPAWVSLGASWGSLGGLGKVLELSLGVLDSLGRVGCSLGRLGAVSGAGYFKTQNDPKQISDGVFVWRRCWGICQTNKSTPNKITILLFV